ncbi:MAG: hypothetical protein OXN17_19345 [Candidatus Poribacteria bacterium]|nr:hypothetical protein [Candidatus Poribacteria bacterium]MDE0504779.1 hypothetical protein [Candidatus Poribacteria bacterium]
MMLVIVDTNVARLANGEWGQDYKECEESCICWLERIMRGEMKLVLDTEWKILGEYSDNLHSRAAGVGNEFLEWCLRNRTNPEKCELVWITPVDNSDTDFREFPDDPALQNFDPDDRKFIAVALTHPEQPPILEATDTEWWQLRDVFHRNGVKVKFICEDDIQTLREGA